MTDRIDHAAKAINIMRDVGTDQRGEIPLELFDSHEQWIYDATMREAQVHATLALVEQQRIANLIALHRHEVKYDIGSWSRLYETDSGSEAVLKSGIAEGLGLS